MQRCKQLGRLAGAAAVLLPKGKTMNREAILNSIPRSSMSQITEKVYSITIKKEPCHMATDGFSFVIFKVATPKAQPVPAVYKNKALSFLRTPNYKVKMQSLLDFLKAEDCKKCPFCDGSGARPVESIEDGFYWQRGDNEPFNNARYVRLFGTLIDGNRIIRHLIHFDLQDEISLYVPSVEDSAKEPVAIYGDGWIFVQMPMADEGETADNFTESL